MLKSTLNKEQARILVLLSIGTFLEYFDLMLYAHMAFILNQLFFPQTDPLVAKLLAVSAFCSTFLLRPIGGYVMGRIGDKRGRKTTITITTLLASLSCILMASIGTYNEIGILATIAIIFCRMLQGVSSLGEVIGASLYLSETFKSPQRNFACGMIGVFSQLGGLLALCIGFFAVSIKFFCCFDKI